MENAAAASRLSGLRRNSRLGSAVAPRPVLSFLGHRVNRPGGADGRSDFLAPSSIL